MVVTARRIDLVSLIREIQDEAHEPPQKCLECDSLQDVVDYPAGHEYGSVTYYDQCTRKGECNRG